MREYYAECQGIQQGTSKCKDEDERFAVQQYFIKDVVYLFIATVCYDLAASHDLIHKTMQEVEDWQLSIDLEQKEPIKSNRRRKAVMPFNTYIDDRDMIPTLLDYGWIIWKDTWDGLSLSNITINQESVSTQW